MAEKIDLTKIKDIRYQPSLSCCLNGRGTIVINSSDDDFPEIRLSLSDAQSVYMVLKEVPLLLYDEQRYRESRDAFCFCAVYLSIAREVLHC
jgi:hypothetical protein